MEIGTKFYRENKKTKEIDELTIVDVQYIFNKYVLVGDCSKICCLA